MHLLPRPGSAAVALSAMAMIAACAAAGSSTSPERSAATSSGEPTAARSSPPSVDGTPPDGLSASLVQYRRDQPRRFVQVKLDNGTGAAVDITLLDVDLPGFGPTRDVRRTTHLEPDRRVDLPVALSDVACGRDPLGRASVTIEVTTDDATVRTVLPVDDDGLLDRLRRFECAVRLADRVVGIALSPVWQRRGSGAAVTVGGTATITAESADVPAEITDVDGGLLFVVEPRTLDPAPPIVVDARTSRTTIEFEMTPARCDGHAIAEARRLTTVTFLVAVDGAEPVPVRRTPSEAGYTTLVSALRERCAAG